MLLPSGNPIKCHEEVLPVQPLFLPTKRFDMSPPRLGDSQKVWVRPDISFKKAGLYVATQSPLGWYGIEKPAAGGIHFGVTITFNGMGSTAGGW